MKKILFVLLLFILLSPLPSCRYLRREQAPPLTFEPKTFQNGENGCLPRSENCTYVLFTYLRFTGDSKKEALEAINDAVSDFLLEGPEGKKPKDLEKFAEQMIASHQEMQKEFPKFSQAWSTEKNVTVEFNQAGVLSLAMNVNDYLGGAHPNSATTLASFDTRTGKKISLGNLFQGGYETKLTAIGERYFRKEKELGPDENLEQAGFFFEKGKFRLNENFLIGSDGLVFEFNPYEVAPYVMGPTRFTIPYVDLKELVSKDGPLDKLRRHPSP